MPISHRFFTGLLLTGFMATTSHAQLQLNLGLQDAGDAEVLPGQNGRAISVPAPADGTLQSKSEGELDAASDILTLANLDSLHGSLREVDPAARTFQWKHPQVADPIHFALDAAQQIQLGMGSEGPGGRMAEIHLTNGDILQGTVQNLDDTHLTLDTWYAGPMRIQRVMISRILPGALSDDTVYAGPEKLENWTMTELRNQPTWHLADGTLHALQSHPIGRRIEGLPDKVRIEFEVGWRGYPQFYFACFTDNIQHYSGNCYLLQASGQSFYMQRYSSTAGSQSLGSANVERFQDPSVESAVFTLLVNREERKLALLIDGELIRQWTDPNPFAGLGDGILFHPQTHGNLSVSHIRISQWDGRIPETVREARPGEDRLFFLNSDKVTGVLRKIADNQATFDTAYATLTVPVERIREARLAPDKAHRARRNRNDVRCTFRSRGAITLDLQHLGAGTLRGSSENFGDATLPLSAFSALEFNIYRSRQDDGGGLRN